MNIFNKFFLYIVLLPSGLYRKMGVHIPHLKAILHTKLTLDDRQPTAMQQLSRKKRESSKLVTIGTMVVSAIMGCVFLFAFIVGENMVTHMSVYFFLYILTLTVMLISDFTTVLIDVRDNLIILPKPVNDNTFLLSRLLHIVIHIGKLAIPMAVPGIIMVGSKQGLAGWLSLMLLLTAATLLTVFLINAIYILILKLTTPEKFKSLISYVQIIFAVLIYGTFQILPRLLPKGVIASFDIETLSWNLAFPPYWFAEGWQYVADGNLSSYRIVYFAISMLAPIVGIWAVIRFFAPSFNQKLSMIGGSEAAYVGGAKPKKTNLFTSYSNAMAGWLTQKGSERMAFLQTWKLTSRSRDFKIKVYPSMGYLLVYFVVYIFSQSNITLQNIENHPELFLGMIYLSGFTLQIAINRLVYSEQYKASWIYHVAPVDTPGRLLSGAIKSLIAKFFIPLAVVITFFCVPINGISIIPNLLFGMVNQLLATNIIAYMVLVYLPFSIADHTQLKGGNFLVGLFTLVILFALGFMHYFLYRYTIIVVLLTVLGCIAIWLIMSSIYNRSWGKIKQQRQSEVNNGK